MGVWIKEAGQWSRTGTRITFTPDRSGKAPYQAAEIAHRSHTFLAWEDDSGPSIKVPIEETERDLDQNPTVLPPYVFFETSATVYQRETKQTHPFHTSPKLLNPVQPPDNRRD